MPVDAPLNTLAPEVLARRKKLIEELLSRPDDQVCGQLCDPYAPRLTDDALVRFITDSDFDPKPPSHDNYNWEYVETYCVQGVIAKIAIDEFPDDYRFDENGRFQFYEEDFNEWRGIDDEVLPSRVLKLFRLERLGQSFPTMNDALETGNGWSFVDFAMLLILFEDQSLENDMHDFAQRLFEDSPLSMGIDAARMHACRMFLECYNVRTKRAALETYKFDVTRYYQRVFSTTHHATFNGNHFRDLRENIKGIKLAAETIYNDADISTKNKNSASMIKSYADHALAKVD